jgi:hypothetical protein
VFLLCDAFFLFVDWALDPLGDIVVVQNEGFGVGFASTLFESSFALLKAGCVVLGSNDGDEDDEGGYDTNEDTLDLMMIKELDIFLLERKRVTYGSKVRYISRYSVLNDGRSQVITTS